MTNAERSLGDLVVDQPGAAKVLQKYRLDYCCNGKQSLADACAAGDLELEVVLQDVEAARRDERGDVRWDQRSLDELVQHLVDHYHAALRTELPRLVELADRVAQVHADDPDHPEGLADLLTDVQAAVESHLAKEEQILFPLILAGRGQTAHMPVRVMVHEHEDHGRSLRLIRELTRDLQLPQRACAKWRELYRGLAELEAELMDHIHLENFVLFPRALAG